MDFPVLVAICCAELRSTARLVPEEQVSWSFTLLLITRHFAEGDNCRCSKSVMLMMATEVRQADEGVSQH